MKLTIKDIKKITQGAAKICENNNRIKFYRFTDAESETYSSEALLATAGVQLEFTTDATELNLSVFVIPTLESRSFFSVDIFADDELIGCIKNFEEKEITGAYALKKYKLGSFRESFSLGKGNKKVRIVLPHSVIAEIEELELSDATYFEPVTHDKTIVMYGDSITQGYDAAHPSNTYATRLASYLGATLYNKGISGAHFIGALPKSSEYKDPDYVTVAYGVNDWDKMGQAEFIKGCSEFMKNISEKYPNSRKIVITPIWLAGFAEEKPFGAFSEVERIIKEICKDYTDIKVVSGWDLVPHEGKMYGDLILHPSDEGFAHYFKNLMKIIES